jgi:hypothetical protein
VSRKAVPGVCGRCGRAVRRPTHAEEDDAIFARQDRGHGPLVVRGHTWEGGRLVRVRCFECEPPLGDWE